MGLFKYRKIFYDSVIISMVLFFFCSTNISAESKENNEQITTACIEALKIIQPINTEKLDVKIGDIYNVINIEGNLDGYSLGYFVDGKPYGYAIYNISSNSIREFMFCPEKRNLYKELEEKAEEYDNVDENKLINGIVYEGGIDYCTYDNAGNKVEYSEDYTTEGASDEENSYNSEELDDIICNKNVVTRSMYGGDFDSLCDTIKESDINSPSTFSNWSVVPDSGLAMITYNYSIAKLKCYCCGITAMTGILNWMGYNDIDTIYMNLWNHSPVEEIEECVINNEMTYYGGVNNNKLINYVNNSYLSDSNTTAYADYDLTYDEIKNHIGNATCGERAPFLLSIELKQYDNSTGDWMYNEDGKTITDGHAVVALSYMNTKSNNTENHYVGIWNTWNIHSEDNKTTDEHLLKYIDNLHASKSIRYINYDDLIKFENIHVSGIMFKNVQSKNIKEVKTIYACKNNIDLVCVVPNGTRYVKFPTWSMASNGSDVFWHEGVVGAGNYATVSIDMSKHNISRDYYATHIYAYDANMKQLAKYSTVLNYVDPYISNVSTEKKTIRGYTLTCKLPTGTTRVDFPTWTSYNGQDDLQFHDATLNGDTAYLTIHKSMHNYEKGVYNTHIYAFNSRNQTIDIVVLPTVELK